MNRGEVWTVRLDPVVGSEQGKTRPCVVVSENRYHRLGIRLVVPLTSWQDRFIRHPNKQFVGATIGNRLLRDSAADAMQLRSVSTERFIERVGQLDDSDMLEISELVASVIGA